MTGFVAVILKSPMFTPRLWPRPILMGFKVLSVIFGLIIIYNSLTPAGAGVKILHLDKLMHALAYASLTGALRLGWPAVWGGIIIIGASLLGVGLEFAQALLAQGRMGSFADAAANVFGVFTALAVLYPFRRRG